MNDRISAAEGALARGAQAVSGAHVDIHDSVRRVLDELDDLAGNWTGGAATSHNQLVAQWSARADSLNATLVHLEAALRGTAQDQAASEEQHQSTIRGLGSLLGGN